MVMCKISCDQLFEETLSAMVKNHKRINFLKEFIAEFEKGYSKGEKIPIQNDIIWELLQNMISMIIIDVSSLIKSFREKGGFLGKIQASFLNLLRIKSHEDISLPMPTIAYPNGMDSQKKKAVEDMIRDRNMKNKKAQAKKLENHFYHLFPNAKKEGRTKAN